MKRAPPLSKSPSSSSTADSLYDDSARSPVSLSGSRHKQISSIHRESRFWGQSVPWPVSRIVRLLHNIFLFEETISKGVPLFRGKIHLLLVYLAPLWTTSLFQCCSSKTSFFAVGLSTACCLFNFSASALLHNRTWSNSMFGVISKLDYVGIFVMISGSCSPVPMLLLSPWSCFAFVSIQWICALIGVSLTLFGQYRDEKHSVRAAVYVFMGLTNCFFMKHLFNCLTLFEFISITSMGALYVIGAIFYGRKSPNPWPGVFGYHELFHSCCFAAGVFTFMLNRSVLTRVALQSFPPSKSLLAHESVNTVASTS